MSFCKKVKKTDRPKVDINQAIKGLTMPIIRTFYPKLIADDIVATQPMDSADSMAFAMRTIVYSTPPQWMTDEFCKPKNCLICTNCHQMCEEGIDFYEGRKEEIKLNDTSK